MIVRSVADGFRTFRSFTDRFCVSANQECLEIKCAALQLVRDSATTAGDVAPGDGWLIGLGLLVADRVSCIFRSIGLAEGFQRFTLRRFGSKRAAQSTKVSCMCTCPVDRISAAGSEDLRLFGVCQDGFWTFRSLARCLSDCEPGQRGNQVHRVSTGAR